MNFSGIKFKSTIEQIWQGQKYTDAFFTVEGESQKELSNYFKQQSMIGIRDIRYGLEDEMIGIHCIFPFNSYHITYEKDVSANEYKIHCPNGLREYLENQVKENIKI